MNTSLSLLDTSIAQRGAVPKLREGFRTQTGYWGCISPILACGGGVLSLPTGSSTADEALLLVLTDGVDPDGSGWVVLTRLADSALRDCRVPDWLWEDCRQEAFEAAVVNAPLWDERRSVPLELFLRQRMRWAIQSYLRSTDRMPESVRRDRRRIEAGREALLSEGLDASDSAVAARLGVPVDRVRYVLSWEVSADTEFASREAEREPWHTSAAVQVERVLAAVTRLPRVERGIVERRFLGGEQTVDIARSYGVTPGRISQLTRRALSRIRAHLG